MVSSRVQMSDDIKPGKFYICKYAQDRYFCTANLFSEHGDVNMKFSHNLKVLHQNSFLATA